MGVWKRFLPKVLCGGLSLLMLPGQELAVCAEGDSAATQTIDVVGNYVVMAEDDDSYDIENASSTSSTEEANTFGTLSLEGDVQEQDSQGDIASYCVNNGNVTFSYAVDQDAVSSGYDGWKIAEDDEKSVNGIDLDSSIGQGALIVESSIDGENWFVDSTYTDIFNSPESAQSCYTTQGIQLLNGYYYRVTVAYQLSRNNGKKKFLVVETDDISFQRNAEVYEFYLVEDLTGKADPDAEPKTVLTPSGSVVNTGKDNGYSGSEEIDKDDPHYNWDIGEFYINGYTEDVKDPDTGNPVYLKNVGDEVALWFNLEQDIHALNNDSKLSIADDKNGYDQEFQTDPDQTYFGYGTLIIQYTDYQGEKHDPIIYTNYLAANARTGANTTVNLYQEGDYDIALDYEIKNSPRKVVDVEVAPTYTDYRLRFSFSIRNGNCMVYPFDLATGDELSNDSWTENGFRLDLAKSRYLDITIAKSILKSTGDGQSLDTRSNMPAKDGAEYTDEGLYVFTVKNRYTGETTTKTICVGTNEILKAYVTSGEKYTIAEIGDMLDQGYTIDDSGKLVAPTAEDTAATEETSEEVSTAESTEAVQEDTETVETSEEAITEADTEADSDTESSVEAQNDTSTAVPAIITVVAVAVAVIAVIAFRSSKKK